MRGNSASSVSTSTSSRCDWCNARVSARARAKASVVGVLGVLVARVVAVVAVVAVSGSNSSSSERAGRHMELQGSKRARDGEGEDMWREKSRRGGEDIEVNRIMNMRIESRRRSNDLVKQGQPASPFAAKYHVFG